MNIPNCLTILRILLTPLLVWLLLEEKLKAALLVFFIAGLTDGLDGFIARVFRQKTKLGAYLDPLADKFLLVSTFILLGIQNLVPDWLVVIAVSRDTLIILGVLTLMFHNIPLEIRPSLLSKTTTLFQLLTLLVADGFLVFGLAPERLPGSLYDHCALVGSQRNSLPIRGHFPVEQPSEPDPQSFVKQGHGVFHRS